MVLIAGNCVCVYYDFSCNYAFLSNAVLHLLNKTVHLMCYQLKLKLKHLLVHENTCNFVILVSFIGSRCS